MATRTAAGCRPDIAGVMFKQSAASNLFVASRTIKQRANFSDSNHLSFDRKRLGQPPGAFTNEEKHDAPVSCDSRAEHAGHKRNTDAQKVSHPEHKTLSIDQSTRGWTSGGQGESGLALATCSITGEFNVSYA